jgi:hypothetical protein
MKKTFSSLLVILPFLLASGMGHADSLLQYEVTITNLTKGQPFSPTVVILHDSQMEPIFTLGEPSSIGIWSIAETGNTAPLVAALTGNPHIYDMQVTDGPFFPGTSVTVVLDGGYVISGQERKLSLAGMLGKTNDSFFALNGVTVPNFLPPYKRISTQVFMANAYDSGTEVNNELCDYVGGCGQGLRLTDGAEGYVYVSSGFHGVGDLDASVLDWKNPVAKITVRVSRSGF